MARKAQKTIGAWERLGELLRSPTGAVLLRVTLAAFVFLSAGVVVRQARAYAWNLTEFRVTNARVEFLGLPTWLAPEMREVLFDPERLGYFSVSIYDAQAAERVRERVLAHPMVEDVLDVNLRYPNQARARVRLRTPLARVRVAGWGSGGAAGELYISEDARLLHPAPYAPLVAELPVPLPRVAGLRAAAPRRLGEVWEDGSERVQEAVAAARMARRLYEDFQGRVWVEEIDVSRFPAAARERDAGEVVLTLSCPAPLGGGRVQRVVQWGRTERARTAVPGEDEYDTKLGRLRTQLTLARVPAVLDVRYDLH